MRSSNALINLVFFLIAFITIFLGLFFVFLPSSMQTRLALSQFILREGRALSCMGFGLLGAGFAFCGLIYTLFRRPYYQIEMQSEGYKTSVELFLLRKNFELYWKRLFSGHDLKSDVHLKRDGRLEFVGEIPLMEAEEREELLKRVEKEMGDFLSEQLAYTYPFFLTLLEKEGAKKEICK